MAKVIRRDIKASDLPREWAAVLDVAPEAIVRVTVDARPRRDVQALLRIADQASEEARRKGLTRDKLGELLDDA